jgi:SNF2 family DNA or RNA helicase
MCSCVAHLLFPTHSYEYFEGNLVTVLKEFQKSMNSANPIGHAQSKTLFTILMSIMSCMRSANIHAMIPSGREFTKCFSPSRRHLLAVEERPKACVCCNRSLRPPIAMPRGDDRNRQDHHNRRRAHVTTEIEMVEGQGDSDDADEVVDEEKDETLLSLPKCLCGAYKGPVKHYAHEKCIEKMKAEGASCPRCADSKKRIAFALPNNNPKYCQHIAPVPGLPGGFTGSSKINAVVKWYRDKVSEDDKVLILSFFKGGLDLLEGIFVEELGIDCARFDGDLDRRRAIEELERFKNDSDCKVLFATVQSGGVGLNIVEANHVAFLDRWYNPFVHSQAEDRCYRIGQKKDVNIVYFDCAATIDEGMIQLNKLKKDNAAVLLADGFEIGNQEAGSLSYKELSGLLGHLMNAIRSHRSQWLLASSGNVDLQIPQFDPQAMKNLVDGFKNPHLKHVASLKRTRDDKGGDKSAQAMKNLVEGLKTPHLKHVASLKRTRDDKGGDKSAGL